MQILSHDPLTTYLTDDDGSSMQEGIFARKVSLHESKKNYKILKNYRPRLRVTGSNDLKKNIVYKKLLF